MVCFHELDLKKDNSKIFIRTKIFFLNTKENILKAESCVFKCNYDLKKIADQNVGMLESEVLNLKA